MKITDKITWMYDFDKSAWGDKINPNRYFATLSLILTALSGALCGGGNTLDSWFGWSISMNMAAMGGALILVWGLNVAESIMATDRISVAVLRPFVILLFMAISFAVSYLLAIIVLVIIAIWVILTLVSGAVSGALSSKGGWSSSGSSGDNSNGEEIELGSGRKIGGRSSADGETFFGNDGKTYSRRGMGSRSWEADD